VWSALRPGRSREAAFLVMDWQEALPTKGSLKSFHCTPRFPSYFIKVASSDVIQYKTRPHMAVVKLRTSIANMGSKSRTEHLQDILWNITGN
jgi:hypothetical protein